MYNRKLKKKTKQLPDYKDQFDFYGMVTGDYSLKTRYSFKNLNLADLKFFNELEVSDYSLRDGLCITPKSNIFLLTYSPLLFCNLVYN